MIRTTCVCAVFVAASAFAGETVKELTLRYAADVGALERKYSVDCDPQRAARIRAVNLEYQSRIGALEWDGLSVSDAVDAVLLRHSIERRDARLARAIDRHATYSARLPFEDAALKLISARREGLRSDAQTDAASLHAMKKMVEDSRRSFEHDLGDEALKTTLTPTACRELMKAIEELRWHLGDWFRFSDGYDPQFSWWCREPFEAMNRELESYIRIVKERGVGITADTPDVIVGTPIGRDALVEELKFEMIPYSPEELIAIGEREHQWCLTELRKAAAEMGFGDDWRGAMERVKGLYVPPGEQPTLIRELERESVAFLKERDLLTIPPLAEETWRLEMMSAQAQKVNPFFLGGESIIIAYPTDGMAHDLKMMSLRGNNRHFARATVHHEAIPGHHLQQFMRARHNQHRDLFETPFWTEGWALYWETRMWDLGFARGPEDRIGMLFWRNHRCARIVFSLKYHMGEMTPQECIEFLVSQVGHERANAEGEIRRSVAGGYGPLYQVAYMMGGIQLRALHRELVQSGAMTEKQFHDRILCEGNVPIEMVRALLVNEKPAQDHRASWKFDAR